MGFMEKLRGSFKKGVDDAIDQRKPSEPLEHQKSQELIDYETGYNSPFRPIQKLGETTERLRPVGEKIVPLGKKLIKFVDEATRPKEGAPTPEEKISRLVGGGIKPRQYQYPQGQLPLSRSQDEAVKRIIGTGYGTTRPKATVEDIMGVGLSKKSNENPKKPKKNKSKNN
jgi:hypothetical protein